MNPILLVYLFFLTLSGILLTIAGLQDRKGYLVDRKLAIATILSLIPPAVISTFYTIELLLSFPSVNYLGYSIPTDILFAIVNYTPLILTLAIIWIQEKKLGQSMSRLDKILFALVPLALYIPLATYFFVYSAILALYLLIWRTKVIEVNTRQEAEQILKMQATLNPTLGQYTINPQVRERLIQNILDTKKSYLGWVFMEIAGVILGAILIGITLPAGLMTSIGFATSALALIVYKSIDTYVMDAWMNTTQPNLQKDFRLPLVFLLTIAFWISSLLFFLPYLRFI